MNSLLIKLLAVFVCLCVFGFCLVWIMFVFGERGPNLNLSYCWKGSLLYATCNPANTQLKESPFTNSPRILVSTWILLSLSTSSSACSILMNSSSPCSPRNTLHVGGDSSATQGWANIPLTCWCRNRQPFRNESPTTIHEFSKSAPFLGLQSALLRWVLNVLSVATQPTRHCSRNVHMPTCEVPESAERELECDVNDAWLHTTFHQLKQFPHIARLRT